MVGYAEPNPILSKDSNNNSIIAIYMKFILLLPGCGQKRERDGPKARCPLPYY